MTRTILSSTQLNLLINYIDNRQLDTNLDMARQRESQLRHCFQHIGPQGRFLDC